MSVNSLNSLYRGKIEQWLDIPANDVDMLINELRDERLIADKYRFECQCGNNCTVYLRKLTRESYFCEECGREYDFEKCKKIGSLVYDLDKNETLSYLDKVINFKEDITRNQNIVYLDKLPIKNDEEKGKMEIFLGSSSEAIRDMEQIAVTLEALNQKTLLWNESGKGIFVANSTIIDSLIAITKRVKAAVFIFNEDDTRWHHNSLKEEKAVRDNVLFEYGLFCGALSKEQVCFICKGNPSIASDLNGVTYIDGAKGDQTVKAKLKDWLENIAAGE